MENENKDMMNEADIREQTATTGSETAPAAQPESTQPVATDALPANTEQEPAPKLPIEKFSARQLLELDACTRCGECSNWCPAYDQDSREPLTPRGRARSFRTLSPGSTARSALKAMLGKLLGKKPVTEEELKDFAKDLYACSTCMQCHFVCPVAIDTVELWERIRETIVDTGCGPLDTQKDLVLKTKNYDNPWGQPRSSRARWGKLAKKKKRIKDEPKDIVKSKSEVLYFVGCTASYDNNVEEVGINTTNILDAAGIDFGILGNKEKCCGSVLLRMGDAGELRKALQGKYRAVQ